MAKAKEGEFECFKGYPPVLLARVKNSAGANITQAALTSITYKVLNNLGATLDSGTVTVSTAVSDTPDTADTRWTLDSDGPNFVDAALPVTGFATTGYRIVEYVFTPTSGLSFVLIFKGSVRSAT